MKTDTTKKYNGNRALKIETLLKGPKYAVSINPVLQPARQTKACIYTWYRKMYSRFVEYRKGLTLELYPEVSPLGRWHFHGSIIIHCMISYIDFCTELNKDTHFEIDTIAEDTRHAWEEYCEKQALVWKNYFSDSLFGYPMCIGKNYKVLVEAVNAPGGNKTILEKFVDVSESALSDSEEAQKSPLNSSALS